MLTNPKGGYKLTWAKVTSFKVSHTKFKNQPIEAHVKIKSHHFLYPKMSIVKEPLS